MKSYLAELLTNFPYWIWHWWPSIIHPANLSKNELDLNQIASRLDRLADWFDARYEMCQSNGITEDKDILASPNQEIQTDLRTWAKALRAGGFK